MLRVTFVAGLATALTLCVSVAPSPAQVISPRQPDGSRYQTDISYWQEQVNRLQAESNRLRRESASIEAARSRLRTNADVNAFNRRVDAYNNWLADFRGRANDTLSRLRASRLRGNSNSGSGGGGLYFDDNAPKR